jgi:hypothetical protein
VIPPQKSVEKVTPFGRGVQELIFCRDYGVDGRLDSVLASILEVSVHTGSAAYSLFKALASIKFVGGRRSAGTSDRHVR